eukprot:13448286-Alexandrium_andersonii.AAC.1
MLGAAASCNEHCGWPAQIRTVSANQRKRPPRARHRGASPPDPPTGSSGASQRRQSGPPEKRLWLAPD